MSQYHKDDLGLFQIAGMFIKDIRDQGVPGVDTSDRMRCDPNNNIRMGVGLAAHYCTAWGSTGRGVHMLWPKTSNSSADCRKYLGEHYWRELGLPGPRPDLGTSKSWEGITCNP